VVLLVTWLQKVSAKSVVPATTGSRSSSGLPLWSRSNTQLCPRPSMLEKAVMSGPMDPITDHGEVPLPNGVP